MLSAVTTQHSENRTAGQGPASDGPIFEIKPLDLPVGTAKQRVADSGSLCWDFSASVADSGSLWDFGADSDGPDA
jgi:hypothetical protein